MNLAKHASVVSHSLSTKSLLMTLTWFCSRKTVTESMFGDRGSKLLGVETNQDTNKELLSQDKQW